MTVKTASVTKKWLPKHERWVHFQHRSTMRRLVRNKAALPAGIPVTTLPVDCTGNATVSCPMLGNDHYGDCGPVMCAHVDEIRTYGQGKTGFTEMSVDQSALIAQYEKFSGGDNGTDEAMLVGPSGMWMVGLAGDPAAVVVDHLDIDFTNAPLLQYCQDQFYAVELAWSVPDDVLQNFQPGVSFLNADTPDPNNGHYSALADVSATGNYRLWTWGSWCWASQAFINSVEPSGFVTFSGLQFSKTTGYDSHGRHISDQAAAWVAMGGNSAIVMALVALFPPKGTPAPVPNPTPTGPTLAQVQSAINAAIVPLFK